MQNESLVAFLLESLPAALVLVLPLYLCPCPGTRQISMLPPSPHSRYEVGSWQFPDPGISASLPTSIQLCMQEGGGQTLKCGNFWIWKRERKKHKFLDPEISAHPPRSKVGSYAQISGQGKMEISCSRNFRVIPQAHVQNWEVASNADISRSGNFFYSGARLVLHLKVCEVGHLRGLAW